MDAPCLVRLACQLQLERGMRRAHGCIGMHACISPDVQRTFHVPCAATLRVDLH